MAISKIDDRLRRLAQVNKELIFEISLRIAYVDRKYDMTFKK